MDLVHEQSENSGKISFASQLTYGPYGSRICTPVCALVSSNFIFAPQHMPISSIFDSGKIQRAMQCSHDLYAKKFSCTKQNLMYQDIASFFPTELETVEFAGVLKSSTIPTSVDSIEDNLFLCDMEHIFLILHKFLLIQNMRFSFMVTSLEHTVCFLFDTLDHHAWCFDPLKASLVLLHKHSHPIQYFYTGLSPHQIEYVGLLLLPAGIKNKLLKFLHEQ